MSEIAESFLTRWHAVLASRDTDALRDLLAEDVTVGAPPHWRRLEGIEVVHLLLRVILDTIEDFTYHRQWIAGLDLALEFRGHVGDRQLQGVDLITLDGEGRVKSLDVMIRPLSALLALREQVGPRMEKLLSA